MHTQSFNSTPKFTQHRGFNQNFAFLDENLLRRRNTGTHLHPLVELCTFSPLTFRIVEIADGGKNERTEKTTGKMSEKMANEEKAIVKILEAKHTDTVDYAYMHGLGTTS